MSSWRRRKGHPGACFAPKKSDWDRMLWLTDFESAVLSSSNIIFALVGTLICFKVAKSLGRRRELILGALLYIAGALVSCLAVGSWMVFVGQALYGLGVGFSMHAAPAYIAEISPACLRGLLISLKEALIVSGILAGFLVGYIFHSTENGWRYMLGFPAILARCNCLA